jgi:hypothetical protein
MDITWMRFRQILFWILAFWAFCLLVFAVLTIINIDYQYRLFISTALRGNQTDISIPFLSRNIFDRPDYILLAQISGALFLGFSLIAWRNGAGIRKEQQHYEQLEVMYHMQSPRPKQKLQPQYIIDYDAPPITTSGQSTHEVQMAIALQDNIINLINTHSKYDVRRTHIMNCDFELLHQGRVVGVGQIINHEPTKQDIINLSAIRFDQKTKLAYLFTTQPVTQELKDKAEFQRVRLFDASDIATMRKKALN